MYLCRPKNQRRVGQGVKTPPFHGGITGSSPVRGTKSQNENESESDHGVLTFFFIHMLFLDFFKTIIFILKMCMFF